MPKKGEYDEKQFGSYWEKNQICSVGDEKKQPLKITQITRMREHLCGEEVVFVRFEMFSKTTRHTKSIFKIKKKESMFKIKYLKLLRLRI